MSSDYNTIEAWWEHEGALQATNTEGDVIAEIDPLQNRYTAAKWNEPYTPGRAWYAIHQDGTITRGHSPNKSTAKRSAQAALYK